MCTLTPLPPAPSCMYTLTTRQPTPLPHHVMLHLIVHVHPNHPPPLCPWSALNHAVHPSPGPGPCPAAPPGLSAPGFTEHPGCTIFKLDLQHTPNFSSYLASLTGNHRYVGQPATSQTRQACCITHSQLARPTPCMACSVSPPAR